MKPKPTKRDREVLLKAVEKLLPKIIEWLKEDPSHIYIPDLIDDLISALSYNSYPDAYELAKYLDRSRGWAPDANLVLILFNVDVYIDEAYNEIEKQWIEESSAKTLFSKIDSLPDSTGFSLAN